MRRAGIRSVWGRLGWPAIVLAVGLGPGFGQAAQADSAPTSLPDASVVEALFPKSVDFGLGEDCNAPAEKGKSKGVALYHVGLHPKNSNRVLVSYALMFVR